MTMRRAQSCILEINWLVYVYCAIRNNYRAVSACACACTRVCERNKSYFTTLQQAGFAATRTRFRAAAYY